MKNFIIVLVVVSMAITGCGKKDKDSQQIRKSANPQTDKPADLVQHKVMSFNLEGLTDKGTKNWDVKGDSAESISESQVKLNNIEAKAYGEDAQAVITADNGIYDKVKNNVTLEKNVIATIENTETGARGFLDMPDTKQSKTGAKAAGDVPKKKTKTVITCDADVIFDYQNNRVYFNKNVKVVSNDGTIDADRITVNMDPATRKMTEIIAEGNVKMTRGENVTYSDKATYIEADKKVALVGQPKLVVYQDGGIAGNILGDSANASTGDSRSN